MSDKPILIDRAEAPERLTITFTNGAHFALSEQDCRDFQAMLAEWRAIRDLEGKHW